MSRSILEMNRKACWLFKAENGLYSVFPIQWDFIPNGWMAESTTRLPAGKDVGYGQRSARGLLFTWKVGKGQRAKYSNSSFALIRWRGSPVVGFACRSFSVGR